MQASRVCWKDLVGLSRKHRARAQPHAGALRKPTSVRFLILVSNNFCVRPRKDRPRPFRDCVQCCKVHQDVGLGTHAFASNAAYLVAE